MNVIFLGAILAQAGPTASVGNGKDASDARLSVWESLAKFWNDVLTSVPYLVVGILILLATWLFASLGRRILEKVLARTKLRRSLADLASKCAYVAVWVLGLLAASIVVTGLGVGQVVATVGLGSIALGFAFKDIVENFFAGLLILWKFPFDTGDFIECEGIEGQVHDIELRMTLIRRTDGQIVVIPNAMMFKNPVRIMTAEDLRRCTIDCGVAYGEDVAESRKVIEEAVKRCESVDAKKPVQVFARQFGASSIDFEVTWWTSPTPLDIRESRDEAVEAVKRALDEKGIEIPYPYRTLTFSKNEPDIIEAISERMREG